MIMPYNRVVKDLNGYSVEDFKKLVSEKFDIQESDKCGFTRQKISIWNVS